jgi:8-oxo-dGTP pyrophosphatase MutT (NUDIX family)
MQLAPDTIRAALIRSEGLIGAVTERMQRRAVDGSPLERRSPPDAGTVRIGAVLALLYPTEHGITLAFTERASHLRNHRGQISFPGGSMDQADVTLWHTAIRETREELGIDLLPSHPWATLTPIYVPPSNFMVTGFVSYIDVRPRFVANPDEVARVIEVPLVALLSDETFTCAERDYQGETVLEGHFIHEGTRIWGATAIILDQLLSRIQLGLELAEHDMREAKRSAAHEH